MVYLKNHMKNKLLLLLVVFTTSIYGQNPKENEWGSWIVIYGTHKISNQFNIITEGRLHDYNILRELDNRFIRVGLNYLLGTNASLTGGYVHQYSETLSKAPVSENRLYEEVTLKNKIDKLAISHRYRIEHRWINTLENTNLFHRFRYRIQLIHSLSGDFYIKLFDELFINFQNSLFNQNRLHFGFGYALGPNFKLEIGYLKNHFSSEHYDRLRLGIVFNTDLRRKSKSK